MEALEARWRWFAEPMIQKPREAVIEKPTQEVSA
jgi:hypothetical protein